jgi:hypothetical protein
LPFKRDLMGLSLSYNSKFYAYASYEGSHVHKRKPEERKYLGRETECDGTIIF